MDRVTSLRRLAHAASIGIGLVCLLTYWSSFFDRDVDIPVQVAALQGVYIVLLVTGVLFIAWLRRARRILMEFKGEYRAFGPIWTLGAWFIPIANLALPPLVIIDVAAGSTTDPAMRRKLVPLVWAWWICFLGNGIVLALHDPDAPNSAQLLGTASSCTAGVLAIVMVYKITDAQRERFSAVTEPNPADFPTFTMDEITPPTRARRDIAR